MLTAVPSIADKLVHVRPNLRIRRRCSYRRWLRWKQFRKKMSRMQPLYYIVHFEIDKSRQDRSAGSCTVSSSSIAMLRALRSRPPFFQNSSIGDDHTLCADVQNSEQNLQNDPVSVEAVDFPQANRLRRTRSSDDIRTDQSRPCRRKRARKIARRLSGPGRLGEPSGPSKSRKGCQSHPAGARSCAYH